MAAVDTAILIRDALVADLNAPPTPWALPFVAEPSWRPVYDADAGQLNALRVAVVPLTIPTEVKLSRQPKELLEYEIAIDVQTLVKGADNALTADADRISSQAAAIHDRYRLGLKLTLSDGSEVDIPYAKRPDIYDVERVFHEHVFETVILVTARVYR